MREPAQSAWGHFVAHQVLPAFHEIKSGHERLDGTSIDIRQASEPERWVSLTWKVAPSASVLAMLPPSMRTTEPPRTVLTYVIGDGSDHAWSETRVPGKAVARETLGDYRRAGLTTETIINDFVTGYQRNVLG